MPTTDLTPGTITTLGALRPGDVARYVINDDKPELTFVVGDGRGWGVYVAHYPGRPALDHYGEKDSPVRYLGRGRIEPARIVMEGEPDRIRELEAGLTWTDAKPTVPGWYWWRRDVNKSPRCLEVANRNDHLRLRTGGFWQPLWGQFAGPIPQPEEKP